ncbi:MAG: hypothetical protein R8M37_03340 [Alphaproteobacteria bacterium]|nr:hypothetical protein [Alphaproteobacteria bacterium]
MTEKERVAKELRKKMNWYLARMKMNQLASKGAFVVAVMASAPYITRFYETGRLGDFMVPAMVFFLAKMSKLAADEANENLTLKRENMQNRLNNIMLSQKTR